MVPGIELCQFLRIFYLVFHNTGDMQPVSQTITFVLKLRIVACLGVSYIGFERFTLDFSVQIGIK